MISISMLCHNLGVFITTALFVIAWYEWHNKEGRRRWLRALAYKAKWIALLLIFVCGYGSGPLSSFSLIAGFVIGCLLNRWSALDRFADWWASPPKRTQPTRAGI